MIAQEEHRFTECWDDCFDRIFRYARHLYRDQDQAEDALAEAFVKLWAHLERVREGSECAWVRAAVLHDYLNWRRHHLKYPEDSLPEGGEEDRGKEIADQRLFSDPVKNAEREAVIQALYECIETLPIGNRRVILLSLHKDNDQQIANALGIPQNTVISRRFAARLKLKRCLTEKEVIGNE